MPRFLVVLDADSTLLADEVIELIADEVGRAAEVGEATAAAMRGDVDFATSLRTRVAVLAGVPVDAFARIATRVRPNPGAEALIAAVHEHGGEVGVVSGGFHEILDVVAPPLGVDVWRANRLAVQDRGLTGAVEGDVVDAAAKAAALRGWAAERGLPLAQTIAVGDGANDLAMMTVAGLGVAFNAKPAVRAAASVVCSPVDLAELIPLLP